MREATAGENSGHAKQTPGLFNHRQIDTYVHMGGRLLKICKQARMVLAGNRTRLLLAWPMVTVTRGNQGNSRVTGRPRVTHHARRHALQRG